MASSSGNAGSRTASSQNNPALAFQSLQS